MNLSHLRAGQLVTVQFSLGHACTTRYAEVQYLSQHGDALCLVDCTGKALEGTVESVRLMTDAEREDWERYQDSEAFDRASRNVRQDVFLRTLAVLLVAERMWAPRKVIVTTGSEVAA